MILGQSVRIAVSKESVEGGAVDSQRVATVQGERESVRGELMAQTEKAEVERFVVGVYRNKIQY